jgi:hypothetical protein
MCADLDGQTGAAGAHAQRDANARIDGSLYSAHGRNASRMGKPITRVTASLPIQEVI